MFFSVFLVSLGKARRRRHFVDRNADKMAAKTPSVLSRARVRLLLPSRLHTHTSSCVCLVDVVVVVVVVRRVVVVVTNSTTTQWRACWAKSFPFFLPQAIAKLFTVQFDINNLKKKNKVGNYITSIFFFS